MTGQEFRFKLRRHLEECRDRVLLRVAVAPNLHSPVELTGGQILAQSEELACRYTAVAESSVVLLLLPHSVELFLLHIGLILQDRLPAILAWPTNRIDPEKYQRNLLHQLSNLPAGQLITLPRLAASLGPCLPFRVTGCAIGGSEQYERAFTSRIALETDHPPALPAGSQTTPADAVFLQFSGGTTGAQKCVVITASMICDQLARLRESLEFTSADTVVSWLPLYHDMGLIANFWFPLWHGATSVQFGAGDWLLRPEMLLEYMDRFHGTFCWLPNFSFAYMAAQRERMKGAYSLAHVRAWINCSEPVRLSSVTRFAEAFADWGVRPESLQASYAMAENVFAATQTPLACVPRAYPRVRLRSEAAELAFQLVDDVYVSSGIPLPGMEVRIVDPSGNLCDSGRPGEIQIRSGCLFAGYWGKDGFLDYALSGDGWYSTEDYGFRAGDDLFVIGRMKDIIIVGGQNVFPEDVEAAVNTVDGVYPGRVVAIGIADEENGTESIAVIAELRGEFERQAATALEREIKRVVLAAIGIAPRYAAVVPERWIVKSTAGKISRRDTRERFREERLTEHFPQLQ
jgi:fatty-acyl-CoA synthase